MAMRQRQGQDPFHPSFLKEKGFPGDSVQAANSSTKGWMGNSGERGEVKGERQTVSSTCHLLSLV